MSRKTAKGAGKTTSQESGERRLEKGNNASLVAIIAAAPVPAPFLAFGVLVTEQNLKLAGLAAGFIIAMVALLLGRHGQ